LNERGQGYMMFDTKIIDLFIPNIMPVRDIPATNGSRMFATSK
jgi:hypothetical protein